jgi:hypothetical protein
MTATASRPLFVHLLGTAFERLPDSVQRLHLCAGPAFYAGEVHVERGNGWVARACAWATHLPPAGEGPILVDIDAKACGERWIRRVGGHAMQSRLWAADGLLRERLGLVTFGFRLGVQDRHLTWEVAHVRALGIPLPARWFTGVSAIESESVDGRYTFSVSAALPLVGPLVRYRGWLRVER